jgi:hypothetical protein
MILIVKLGRRHFAIYQITTEEFQIGPHSIQYWLVLHVYPSLVMCCTYLWMCYMLQPKNNTNNCVFRIMSCMYTYCVSRSEVSKVTKVLRFYFLLFLSYYMKYFYLTTFVKWAPYTGFLLASYFFYVRRSALVFLNTVWTYTEIFSRHLGHYTKNICVCVVLDCDT